MEINYINLQGNFTLESHDICILAYIFVLGHFNSSRLGLMLLFYPQEIGYLSPMDRVIYNLIKGHGNFEFAQLMLDIKGWGHQRRFC